MFWKSYDVKMGKIERHIHKKVNSGRKMHFGLIDPDLKKLSPEQITERCRKLKKWGTDLILLGGSTGFSRGDVDVSIDAIRKGCKLPIVLYPSKPEALSSKADGILFMSLFNSKDPWWLTEAQAKSSLWIKQYKLEPLPMAYIIVHPGMTVGKVGKAKLIKPKDTGRAASYALAAQMFGFRLVYLEAGSGATNPVPIEMVSAVSDVIDIPLIVGGGIKDAETARVRLKAGADIIVTGTAIENDMERHEAVVRAIKEFRG